MTKKQKAEALDKYLSANGLRFHAEDKSKAELWDSINTPKIELLEKRVQALEKAMVGVLRALTSLEKK